MKNLVHLFVILFTVTALSQNNILDIEIKNLNLEELNLSEAIDSERYTLISVGGTWCKPCLEQKPFVTSLGKQYPHYLKVIYLYYRDTPEKIKTIFGESEELNDSYLVEYNSIEQLSVIAYPTNILVDKYGYVIDNDVSINDVGSLIK